MMRTYCICLILFFFLHTSIAAPISLQKRALTPHNPGNGGNNNGDQGNTPFPTSNQRQNIVQSRVIRLREQVNRPPELPAGHPIRPYQPTPVRHQEERRGIFGRILGGGNKKDEKGKGKVGETAEASTSNTKKRKANEMQNDHEAGPSEPIKKKKTFKEHLQDYADYENKKSRYKTGEALGKLGAEVIFMGAPLVFGAGQHAYRAGRDATGAAIQKVKETCDAACRRARGLRDRILRRPQTQFSPPTSGQHHSHNPNQQAQHRTQPESSQIPTANLQHSGGQMNQLHPGHYLYDLLSPQEKRKLAQMRLQNRQRNSQNHQAHNHPAPVHPVQPVHPAASASSSSSSSHSSAVVTSDSSANMHRKERGSRRSNSSSYSLSHSSGRSQNHRNSGAHQDSDGSISSIYSPTRTQSNPSDHHHSPSNSHSRS